jgi:hypothetical protein
MMKKVEVVGWIMIIRHDYITVDAIYMTRRFHSTSTCTPLPFINLSTYTLAS